MSTATFCPTPLLPKRPRRANRLTHTPKCTASFASSSPEPDESLQQKVESYILASEQRSDLIPPNSTNRAPLPVQLDLLNYHARVASRRRATRSTAERLYRRCIDINSTDGRAWLGLARLQIGDGDIDAARRTFRNGIRASRNNAHLLQAWGVMEERQNCIERARGLYMAAVRADASHCASWVALGLWHRKFSKDLVEAREAFKRGAEADPGNYYVWHVLGVLEKDCRRFGNARECFRRGAEANPNNAATFVMWGCLEDRLGNYDKAIELFETAHKAHPRNTHAYVSHAMAAERAGFVDKAQSLLEVATAIRPNDPGPRQALGLLQFRRGRIDECRAQFRAALDVDEKHGPSWHAWACVEQELGFLDRARELFQEGVWAAPRNPHVVRIWHSWGMLELAEGNVEVARRYFSHGLEVEATCIPLLTGLATLEATQKNMTRAREYLEKCIRLDPSRNATWRLYEQLERDFGSVKRARLVYERSVVTAQRVDERLVVSKALPGDYKAGGMWIDPLELSPNESAFDSISDGSNVVTKGRSVSQVKDGDLTNEVPLQSRVTTSRRSTPPKRYTTRQRKSQIFGSWYGPSKFDEGASNPVFPPNMPFAPNMPS